jgi:hypothetical protein
MTCRITVVGVYAHVYAPYQLRELIKTFPGRRWLPDLKCWRVDASMVNALADALRAAGEDVFFTAGGRDTSRPSSPSTPSPTWAEHLFAAVGPARHDAAYRALSKVLHPDVDSGDRVVMQQLNDARPQLPGDAK